MQIRRVRFQSGSYIITGQIMNVPIDWQETVRLLPLNLVDKHAFNASFKKHIIHKTSAYSGLVKKAEVKHWLRYLEKSPLYRLCDISVDWSLCKLPTSESSTSDAGALQALQRQLQEVEVSSDTELLLADQQTLLWSEDNHLSIAPGHAPLH